MTGTELGHFGTKHEIAPSGITSVLDCAMISPDNLPPRLLPVTPKPQVEVFVADLEIHHGEVGQPGRQCRVDIEPAARCVRLKAEDRLQKGEGRTSSPSLRHICAQILNGKVSGIALDAGVELRHLMQREIARRSTDVAGDTRCFFGEAISAEAHRNDRVVVWPYRAVLIRIRVVSRMVGGQSTNPPATPHVRLHQSLHDTAGAIGRDNARPETMAGIRSDGQDLALLAV